MCEYCGSGPTCCVCGRDDRPNCLPGSAWDTWKRAGAAFARACRARRISVVGLGEQSAVYAASRGLPHQDIIRRAFVEGYFSA